MNLASCHLESEARYAPTLPGRGKSPGRKPSRGDPLMSCRKLRRPAQSGLLTTIWSAFGLDPEAFNFLGEAAKAYTLCRHQSNDPCARWLWLPSVADCGLGLGARTFEQPSQQPVAHACRVIQCCMLPARFLRRTPPETHLLPIVMCRGPAMDGSD